MNGLARANILILVLLLAGSSFVMARPAPSGLHFKGDLPREMGLFLLVLLVATCVILLAVAVLVIAALWRIFEKAGQPGWASLVPIYNLVVLLRVVGKPDWWIVLMLIPLVNFGVSILINIELARVFGMEEIFAVGLVLMPAVFYPILAFGKAEYAGAPIAGDPMMA